MSAPHAALLHPTTEQCLAIADQIADCGVMRVSLTGGEPLIRKDFLQIADRILERGMRIDTIMTNGALVDEALSKYALTAGEEFDTYLAYIPQYLEDGMPVPILTLSALFNAFDGRMTLSEALSDSFYMDFISATLDDYLAHNPTCASCAYKNRCGGGCRGRAVDANNGTDLLGIDPDACLIFKGGYYDRVKQIIERFEVTVAAASAVDSRSPRHRKPLPPGRRSP